MKSSSFGKDDTMHSLGVDSVSTVPNRPSWPPTFASGNSTIIVRGNNATTGLA